MARFIEGFPIGDPGDPHAPLVEMMQESYGITVSPVSISRWRAKAKYPIVTTDRARSSKLVVADDAILKDHAYLSIASSGVRQRRTRETLKDTETAHVLASNGFTGDLANDVGIKAPIIRNALRSMRAEIVFDPTQLSENHRDIFVNTATAYLSDHTLPHVSTIAANYKSLLDNWDRSVPHFYQLMYANGQPRMIGSWAPYEVAFLRLFYQDRIARGSKLSGLDCLVLSSYRDGANLTDLGQYVRDKTNVPVNWIDLAEHRNFLIFGKPHNPDLLSIRS